MAKCVICGKEKEHDGVAPYCHNKECLRAYIDSLIILDHT